MAFFHLTRVCDENNICPYMSNIHENNVSTSRMPGNILKYRSRDQMYPSKAIIVNPGEGLHGVVVVEWHAKVNVATMLDYGASITLLWRHNRRDGVSNHQPHDYLLNRLFRRRSNTTSEFRVTGLCEGNSPVTGDSPYKGPITRKMFPFDDVIIMRL